jgi:hypothetical protein
MVTISKEELNKKVQSGIASKVLNKLPSDSTIIYINIMSKRGKLVTQITVKDGLIGIAKTGTKESTGYSRRLYDFVDALEYNKLNFKGNTFFEKYYYANKFIEFIINNMKIDKSKVNLFASAEYEPWIDKIQIHSPYSAQVTKELEDALGAYMLFVQDNSTEYIYNKKIVIFYIMDRNNSVSIISGILEKVPTLYYRYNLQDSEIQDEISDATERAYRKIYDKISDDLKILKNMDSIEIYEYFMKFRDKYPKHNVTIWYPKKDLEMMKIINKNESSGSLEKAKALKDLEQTLGI